MVNMERTSVAAAQISAQSHAKIGPILDAAVERFEASSSSSGCRRWLLAECWDQSSSRTRSTRSRSFSRKPGGSSA